MCDIKKNTYDGDILVFTPNKTYKDTVDVFLRYFLDIEKGVDTRAVELSKITDPHTFHRKRVLAALVELGELANDWRGFKFWATNQEPKGTMPEEFIDVFNFVLGIILYAETYDFIDKDVFSGPVALPDIECATVHLKSTEELETAVERQIINMFNLCSTMETFKDPKSALGRIQNADTLYQLLKNIFLIAGLLNIGYSTIIDVFNAKNKVNHNRLDTGY